MRFCMRMDRQTHPKESEALILNALQDFPNQPLQLTHCASRLWKKFFIFPMSCRVILCTLAAASLSAI